MDSCDAQRSDNKTPLIIMIDGNVFALILLIIIILFTAWHVKHEKDTSDYQHRLENIEDKLGMYKLTTGG